jgi:hypothetical protein
MASPGIFGFGRTQNKVRDAVTTSQLLIDDLFYWQVRRRLRKGSKEKRRGRHRQINDGLISIVMVYVEECRDVADFCGFVVSRFEI